MITDILNPLGLKFTEPTRVEEIILREIINQMNGGSIQIM
jgi:hypothetical protein